MIADNVTPKGQALAAIYRRLLLKAMEAEARAAQVELQAADHAEEEEDDA